MTLTNNRERYIMTNFKLTIANISNEAVYEFLRFIIDERGYELETYEDVKNVVLSETEEADHEYFYYNVIDTYKRFLEETRWEDDSFIRELSFDSEEDLKGFVFGTDLYMINDELAINDTYNTYELVTMIYELVGIED